MSLADLNLEPPRRSQPTNPLDIFDRLTLRGAIENLWAPQGEALRLWDGVRESKDIIVQMNTGGGKTLVGLLIAQALVNELRGRVLYVCPTIQLVEQVQAKAKEVSLDVATYTRGTFVLQDEFEACRVPCITTYAALLNGKSIFARHQIRGVIFDDAHVSTAVVQEQFTLRISREQRSFQQIVALFRPYFVRNNQVQKLDDARVGDERSLLLIPTFEVSGNVSQLRKILLDDGVDGDSRNTFAWSHVKDHLNLCIIVLTGSGLEITPPLPPIEALPVFDSSVRRVYLTASVPSQVQLLRTFGVKDAKSVTPGGKSGEAQRQFIFTAGETDEEGRARAKDLVEPFKAAIITPSHFAAGAWCPPAEKFEELGEAQLDAFRKDERSRKIVMAARYDGVDLPGRTCRVLVLDGLPAATAKYQRFLDESLRIERLRSQATAVRLTQAMGRIFRSNTDHGAIVVVGGELKRWLTDPNNQELMPPLLQRQIQLGLELAKKVQEGGVSSQDLLNGVLSGDPEWDKIYANFIEAAEVSTAPAEPEWLVNVIARERTAFSRLWSGNCAEAANLYMACAADAERHSELRLAAWLRHWEGLSRLLLGDKDGATKLYLDAASHRSELGRPDYTRRRISHTPAERPSDQAKSMAAILQRGIDSVRANIAIVLDQLTYDASTNQVEEALKELGVLMGLDASRPDKELGTGPDVLWLTKDLKDGALMDAKTKKSRTGQYSKDDIGQMHDHVQWANRTYPNTTFKEFIVGPPLSVSKDANPSPRLQISGIEDFGSLALRTKDLYDDIVAVPSGEPPDTVVEGALRSAGLRWPTSLDGIASRLAVDLKHDPDVQSE